MGARGDLLKTGMGVEAVGPHTGGTTASPGSAALARRFFAPELQQHIPEIRNGLWPYSTPIHLCQAPAASVVS
ncbi:hypothetical protein ANO11243_049110 [Dothideomycetidae sp. 11243]|nr:hypothetical protein ANO11243_049110 [fungal sp. No.11243]